MIIQLQQDITDAQLEALKGEVEAIDYKVREVRTQYGEYLVGLGKKAFDLRKIGHLDGVRDIHRVSDAYKLVSRKWKAEATRIQIDGELSTGSGDLTLMAGPCSIEGEEQIRETVAHLAENGVKVMRGGVYKPRSSPYSFRGLGIDGLKVWHQVAREHGIRIITEVMHTEQIEQMIDYIDIFQVGARNSQNFNLLDALGEVDKPVMIKRGMSGTLEELLQSAEYVFARGNERILLCERGIRTYEKAYRNTLDLNAIPILKEKTHLPVIVDPSHGIGLRRYVESMALAGVMAGADGLIVEVHACPEKAFSDGQQTLNFREAGALYRKVRRVYATREEVGGY
ncbi:MAG: 3-deoxy-7-phosphoheptulonate synthase [Bacteroidota bacterium]